MSFQTRLLVTYSLLIIAIVVIIGVVFYQYNADILEDKAYFNIDALADKMSQQLDGIIKPMDFLASYLISDETFMSSMASLSNLDDRNPENLIYVNEGYRNIRSVLVGYSISKNFYKVNVFNRKGYFLSSDFMDDSPLGNIQELIDSIGWLDKADSAGGRMVLLTPYIDPWASNDKMKVFSLVRCIEGPKGKMGYIEVQDSYDKLENIFSVPRSSNINVVAVTDSGEIFYNNNVATVSLLKYYSQLALSDGNIRRIIKNPVTNAEEVIARASSEYTGVKIILAQDKSAILGPIVLAGNMTVIIGIIIVALSFVYIYLFSKQLAKPIRHLKYEMEKTELENLSKTITVESSNDEIKALNDSFEHLRERLNEAIDNEIKSRLFQMQANFDSLQAQINPHFIYNILNVLSNKGLEDGDEEICEICDSIAAMLRYSTSTLQHLATVGDELEHVKNYLVLMKKRFEHRLEFEVNIDSDILSQPMPKLVLQPIVENSINHGFENVQKVMHICIRSYESRGWWYIEIADNGEGFSQDVLAKLNESFKMVKEAILNARYSSGYEIGGLGLVNTYARMALFYNGEFEFKVENIETGGAKVTIGGTMKDSEEGGLYDEDYSG
ncbi:sensor histidine kinase [Mahella australiensis]|uniref:Integral membrane sensor signal transduction histidine kinase n=1 Tax=Mahella australiensis (strain DSM 15567 / CIP 107919 / 50-1 BON) TaxID=697281 RepID=F3ZY61_MAHA5|nr:histidine kinase [Mahella australiensis]AEE97757.1 integral membrane sensor signal transduction histidine kinase [Mahella australiensis 50-1 BON]